jgi:hypothetical protein
VNEELRSLWKIYATTSEVVPGRPGGTRTPAILQSALDEDNFAGRWAEGRTIAMEAAMAYAGGPAGPFGGEMGALQDGYT